MQAAGHRMIDKNSGGFAVFTRELEGARRY